MSVARRSQRTATWVIAALLCAGLGAACGRDTDRLVSHGTVDVGGYSLNIVCKGEGTPAVIFDSGLGMPGEEWRGIQDEIRDETRACFYDRVGLGESDGYPKETYTTQDTVADLHNLLKNANIPGPYVLVAHSLAGFTGRVYAAQYPEEVAGMVWIDVSHPDQVARLLALYPPESPDEPDSVTSGRAYLRGGYAEHAAGGPEFIDYDASAAQVRSIASLGSIPLAVLTRGVCGSPDDFPPELGDSLCQERAQMHEELAMLSSNSTIIAVETANHFIYDAEPEAVINAIRDVVAEARGE
jgi:pimeloyl-ACP methyl ester carboxylesterase